MLCLFVLAYYSVYYYVTLLYIIARSEDGPAAGRHGRRTEAAPAKPRATQVGPGGAATLRPPWLPHFPALTETRTLKYFSIIVWTL